MNENNKLDNLVTISQRYRRSVRLDTDINSDDALKGFILQRSGAVALETIADHIKTTDQRAFTITGPYGSGKSSLSLFLSLLAQGNNVAYSIFKSFAEKNIGYGEVIPTFCKTPSFDVKVFTGHKGKLESEIIDWIEGDSAKSFRENLTFLKEQSNERFPNGLIIVVDELGKYLEGAQSDNCYALQELAEVLNRTKNIIFVGILHQSFVAYVNDKSLAERNEWSKVQGRFVDIPLLAAPDEILQMTAEAVICDEKNIPVEIDRAISLVVDFLASKKRIDRANFTKTLKSCWPLNPTVALLLGTLSRRAFFQNTRSVFNFLTSREPLGFKDFLEKTEDLKQTYSFSNLWDYLTTNYEQAIVTSIKESRQFSLASECISNSQKIGPDAVRLVKSISVLYIFGYGSELIATKEILLASMPDLTLERLEKCLNELIKNKITIEHKFKQSFSLFDGSDFDFEKAFQELDEEIDEIDPTLIDSVADLSPIIAKRHYSQTGALRWFSRKIVVDESQITKLINEDGASGSLCVCLKGAENLKAKLDLQERLVLRAYPQNSDEINSVLKDL